MKSRSVFHLVPIFALLFSLLGSAATITPVSADLPAEFTVADWQQILTLLPHNQQAYLKASNSGINDKFGGSVAISGDTVVVGAPNENSNATGVNGNEADNSASGSGAAYVFIRSGTTWIQQAYLKASNTDVNDAFGNSVAISGDTIVVGATGEGSNATGVNGNEADNSALASGAAYVFTRNGSVWSQQAYLKASNTEAEDFFGISVAISGDTIVVGAYVEDSNATGMNGNQADNSNLSSGAVYVFTRSSNTWSQQAYLKASNTGTGDGFGYSVAISNNTVVVGASGEDSNSTGVNGNEADNSASNSGAAYVFTRSGSVWSQQAYLKASNTGADDRFGYSVTIFSDTIVVGALWEASNATGVNGNQADNSAYASGAVYVFTRSSNTWSQQAYLKASNTGTNDYFGGSVAISGDTVVVGAYQESSNATGVNGDQADNSASFSGAAYVFTRSGTTWSQTTYLKASNTGAVDVFSCSVAISGDTVVVGAFQEDSNATGVNGNGADNSKIESGAAYVFAIPHTVIFDANGGSGLMGDQIASSPTALTANAFTRSGYSFSGWNTAANGTGTAYADGTIYDFSADVTLYAQWAIANRTVTFNANGGSGSMEPQVNNLPAVLTANAFTRTGYSFSGWNTAANGSGTSYANGATYDFSADVSLYAQWTVLTPTFADVPLDYWSWQYIESLYNSGITGGCTTNPLNYCPTASVTRAQMAVFLLKGIHGPSYASPTVNGSTGFNDVTVDYWAAAWIKQLAAEGITGGCGNGNYCPENTVTRDQMAVFLLKAKYGSSYAPPAVNGSTGFTDVPADYWAAAWIKQLAAEAITGGCGGGLYCPSNPVTRDQMAVFLQRTFNLPLP